MAFTGNTTSFPASFFLCACSATKVALSLLHIRKRIHGSMQGGGGQHLEGVLLGLHKHPGSSASGLQTLALAWQQGSSHERSKPLQVLIVGMVS